MRTRVYIAGPISKGPLNENIGQATQAAMQLLKAGFAPLCPHLTCYMGGPAGNPIAEVLPDGTTHEDWYQADLPWVAVSDVVLRLPGESVGADLETRLARALAIPIYYAVDDLILAGPGRLNGHAGYLRLLQEMAALHRRKASDYGSEADPLANLRASEDVGIEPWRAAWLRAKDKVRRIDTFCQRGTLANEGVEDSLKDLAAYCLLALTLRREKEQQQEAPES